MFKVCSTFVPSNSTCLPTFFLSCTLSMDTDPFHLFHSLCTIMHIVMRLVSQDMLDIGPQICIHEHLVVTHISMERVLRVCLTLSCTLSCDYCLKCTQHSSIILSNAICIVVCLTFHVHLTLLHTTI
jgi:hypothetical protein